MRSGPFEIEGVGDKRMLVRGLIADERTEGQAQATLFTREFPQASETTWGPYSVSEPIDVMLTTRQLEMRIDFTTAADARIGLWRVDAQPVSHR